ncbi:sulfotransferase domain-containing protein [Halomonas rhizosphaerae]|uniref:Sulfotransferase domain-containing protein n=1 Tax=Halomonas rhizosphaerae TaxID=3043296 RepID=A0ABT6UWI5_9GAMM|nr:sulfotransferase domain-containing protein [Halomonas rhizosphaerae]MDI5890286.1 sulfotransferase domain-containing protein [Halomonas rhizosphaerae]
MLKKTFFKIGKYIVPHGKIFSPNQLDVMLVSYPKSGNTWVRALVAHLIADEPSLSDMEKLIPDIYKANGRVLNNAYVFNSGGRLLKSHESFNPKYKKIIYIARDPRDVCVSYYHYKKKINKLLFEDGIDKFVDSYLAGKLDSFGTWSEHIKSWECAEEVERLFLRYEDIVDEPVEELKKVADFLGIKVSEKQLCMAVDQCKIDNLRAKEKSERRSWRELKNSDKDGSFFRVGGSNNWSELSKLSCNKIEEKWGGEMEKLGYSISSY